MFGSLGIHPRNPTGRYQNVAISLRALPFPRPIILGIQPLVFRECNLQIYTVCIQVTMIYVNILDPPKSIIIPWVAGKSEAAGFWDPQKFFEHKMHCMYNWAVLSDEQMTTKGSQQGEGGSHQPDNKSIQSWYFHHYIEVVATQRFFLNPEPWGNDPIWLAHIFQMGWWKTTDQICVWVFVKCAVNFLSSCATLVVRVVMHYFGASAWKGKATYRW